MATAVGLVWLAIAFAAVTIVAHRNRGFATALMVAFGARAVVALFDALVFRLPGQDDSLRFDYFAHYQARNGVLGTFDYIGTGAALYTWLTSFFYALFERSRLMMQALNVLFGALIVLNVGKLVLALGGSRGAAVRTAWVAALFPSLVFFSGVMLREIAVAYPLSLGALYLTRWHKSGKLSEIVGAVAALLVSMAFHSGAFAVLLATGGWFVVSWVRSLFSGRARGIGRASVGLLVGVAAIGFVVSSDFGMNKFANLKTDDVSSVGVQQAHFAKGRTAYLEDVHPETGTEVVLQAPLRLAYFLFAPFPWMISEVPDLVGLVDSFLFFYLFFRVWRARAALRENATALLVLTVFAAMALMFAMGVSNYGTAHRHRSKMLPLLLASSLALPLGRRGRGVDATPRPTRPDLAYAGQVSSRAPREALR